MIVKRTQTEIHDAMMSALRNGVDGYPGISSADKSRKGYFGVQYNPFAQAEAEGDVKLQEISDGAFLGLATGDYLTELVKNFNKDRKAAAVSEVFLDFTGTDATTIAKGTKAQVPATIENSAIVFETQTESTIKEYATTTISFNATNLTIDDSASGFTFSTDDYIQVSGSTSNNFTYKVTAQNTSSLTVSLVYSTDSMTTEVAGDSVVITRVFQAKSLVGGVDKNVGAGTITQIQVPISGVTAVTNLLAATGGDDIEDDTTLRARVIADLPVKSKTTELGYKSTVTAYAGVSDAYIVNGGAVTGDGNRTNIYIYPVISTGTGIPTQSFCDDLKTDLFTGETGEGNKNITHTIYCQPPTAVSINITAAVTATSGSSTSVVQAAIVENLEALILGLNIGDDVLLIDIYNAIHDTAGVYNFTISTPTGDTSVGVDEKAIKGTFTITVT